MNKLGLYGVIFLFVFLLVGISCTRKKGDSRVQTAGKVSKKALIARGKYLVTLGGCNDCHSPKKMSPKGPIPDSSRLLSGHPGGEKPGKIDAKVISSGKWILAGADFTYYVGPWGISYASNLTPDSATGIGSWNLQTFIKTIREGKLRGSGRPLSPPMPWQAIRKLSDQDLKAIFLYLKSLKPISNQVPQPVPPNKISALLGK